MYIYERLCIIFEHLFIGIKYQFIVMISISIFLLLAYLLLIAAKMDFMRKILLLAFVVISFASFAQKKKYNTSRFDGNAPHIDGIIDDACWDHVEWDGDFIQWMPANGAAASQDTRFKIIYDDNYLYVAIRAFDDKPEEIVNRMSRRDGFEGDFVEINIDSHHDYITAYSFSATVAGVKGDERITEDGFNWDDTWNPIWYLKTSIDKEGWVAEIKIPMTQLRFSKDSVQVWGIEVKRMLYRKDERSVWQPIDNTTKGYVSKFGELHGIENLKPKRQFDITPYVVGSYEHYKEEEGSSFYPGKNLRARAGVDAKIGLTNNITMDLSILPDFGQVEADPSEVNLTAFESYFDEQRPFFIEGRNIYNFPLDKGDGDDSNNGLFYSRRIGRSPQYYPDHDYVRMPENTKILGAAKVSGKTKKGLSIGIMESVTDVEKAQVKNEGGEEHKLVVEPMTNYFVARVEQEINEGTTKAGGMFTSTNRVIKHDHLDGLVKDAYTGGINIDHSWNERKYNINFKLMGSSVAGDSTAMMDLQTSSRRYYQRPDAKENRIDSAMNKMQGHGGFLSFAKFVSSGLGYMVWVDWRSPGFELNDIGFLRSTDQINQVGWIGYTSPQPKGILRRYSMGISAYNTYNFDGTHLNYGGNINTSLRFTNYWGFGFGSNYRGNTNSTSLLRGGPIFKLPRGINYWVNIRSDERKKVVFRAFISEFYGAYDYSQRRNMGMDIEYRPNNRLKVSLDPFISFRNNKIQYVTTEDFQGKEEYFLAELDQKSFVLEFRLDYSFTPDLSLQFYGQPFVSSGKYTNYKRVLDSKSPDYESRFELLELNEDFEADIDNDGTYDVSLEDNDFKYLYFQSNLVLRWEYLPGSTVFLVWSQARDEGDFEMDEMPFEFNEDVNRMFRIFPHDVFLMKLSYRIPI